MSYIKITVEREEDPDDINFFEATPEELARKVLEKVARGVSGES